MLIGESRSIQDIRNLIGSVGPSSDPVLIQGETGVGKELVAQAIHAQSHRKDRPFITFNTALFNSELLRNDLFGHEKGSFTGAGETRTGLAERAHLGTLFLDEIKEMSIELQTRLLRFLDSGEINKVGAHLNSKNHVDVRIITATNTNLETAVGNGQFRTDIFYRLSCFKIDIPPLRDRKEDIPILAKHFLSEIIKERSIDPENHHPSPALAQKYYKYFTDASINFLAEQTWPGNVRQLRFAVRSVAFLVKKEEIRPEHFQTTSAELSSPIPVTTTSVFSPLPDSESRNGNEFPKFQEYTEEAQKSYLDNLIKTYSNLSQRKLAQKAGLPLNTFKIYIRRHELIPKGKHFLPISSE